MESPKDRFADPLHQEEIKGQGKIAVPQIEAIRTRIQPYVIEWNLAGTLAAPIAGFTPSPQETKLDDRTRHLRFVHDGAATIAGAPPADDIFWTWGQAQGGSRGMLHPGDERLFDDLFLEYLTLFISITTGTSAHVFIYGW